MRLTVVEDPTSHSLSPTIHNTDSKVLGLDDTYEALYMPVQDFDNIREIIAEKNLGRSNIATSHKERIIPFLNDVDKQAKTVGAVNTVKIGDSRWIDHSTDGLGYVKGLRQVYPGLSNAYILTLGVGSASKGIAATLLQCIQPRLTIADRTMSRLDSWRLDTNTITLQQAEQYPDGFDITTNTASAGLDYDKENVVRLDQLSLSTLVGDTIYIPYKTSFLQQTEEKGSPIYNDLDIFIYQGAESFKIWIGKNAETRRMKLTVLNQLKGE